MALAITIANRHGTLIMCGKSEDATAKSCARVELKVIPLYWDHEPSRSDVSRIDVSNCFWM